MRGTNIAINNIFVTAAHSGIAASMTPSSTIKNTWRGRASTSAKTLRSWPGEKGREPASERRADRRDGRRGRARATARVPTTPLFLPRPYKDTAPPEKPIRLGEMGGESEMAGEGEIAGDGEQGAEGEIRGEGEQGRPQGSPPLPSSSPARTKTRLRPRLRRGVLVVFVRAGVEWMRGGDPCGRPCPPSPLISLAGWLPSPLPALASYLAGWLAAVALARPRLL